MKQTPRTWVRPIMAGLIAGLLLPALSRGQTIDPTTEGLDPSRQITTQILKTNLLIVLDRSGSLTFTADASPANACSSNPPTNYNNCWSYDGSNYGYAWWEFKYTNAGSTWSMAGAIPSAADFGISHSSASFLPQTGSGNGFWVRAGQDQIWSALIASSTYKTRLYINGSPGWAKGTQVTIAGAPSSGDNGTYYTCAAMATDGNSGYASGLYYYTTVSTTYSSGSCGTTKSFASTPYPAWMTVQKVGTTAGQSLWYFMPPSRMAAIKNALGNSVTIYQPSATSSGTDGSPDQRAYYLFPGSGGPTGGAYFNWYTKAWVNWSPTTAAPAGDPAYTSTLSPFDVVGNTSSSVNWGLLYFYGSSVTTVVNVNPDDSNQSSTVATIETALSPVGAGGLNPYDGTPTVKGLDTAKSSLTTTWNADTKTNCGRLYADILITDGESNTCNASGGQWASGCTGYTTLSTLRGYPPGRTDELFLKTADSTSGCTSGNVSPTNVQTFVVGVSPDVAACELNLDAYFGRTDASATNPSKWQGSSRLPQNTTSSPATTLANYSTTGNYAFFASDPAVLATDLTAIVASFGTGSYTTSPLAVSSNPASTSNYLSFVPATGYPAWEGDLFCYDLNPAYTTLKPPFHPLLWDAGDVLSNHANNGMVRRIITWDPSKTGDPIVWIAGANAPNPPDAGGTFSETDPSALATTLDALCVSARAMPSGSSCGITTAVVDFMRGYDGTANPPTTMTGTRRSWLLGPLMNTTPVVIGIAEVWKQAQLKDHSAFEQVYGVGGPNGGRHPLVWAGSSDGMAHAFDVRDGAEVMALLPPDLLYKQAELYQQYKNPAQTVTGEMRDPNYHVYGVANSLRFADIYDSSSPLTTSGGVALNYRTILYLTEGGRMARWAKSTAYPLGIVVNPTAGNGHIYRCTVAGNSAATEPTWPTTAGATVTDGSVTWKEFGAMSGTALHAVDVTNAYPGRASAKPPNPLPTPTPTPTPVSASGTPTPTPTCAPTPTPGPPPTPTAGPTPLPTATPVPTVIPADQNYSVTAPVQPLWGVSRTGFGASAVGKVADLGQTWSMPALGASTSSQWELTIGAGFDERYPTTGITAHAFHFNALTGALIAEYNLAGVSSGARVRSQAFGDSVIFGMKAPYFRPDNMVTQSVQVDLTGQVWTMDPTSTSTTTAPIVSLGGGQPIYYSVAAVGFPASNPTMDLYAFGTGSFYEQSSNVSGTNAFGVPPSYSATSPFYPELVVAARQAASPYTVTYKAVPIYSATTPLTGTTYCSDPGNQGVIRTYHPGRRTQLVAPPLILTSLDPTVTKAEALFLIYDPDDRCGGTTSIVVVVFDTAQLSVSGYTPTLTVYDAGEGASGGFAIAGSSVYLGKSVIGAGGNAYSSTVPNLKILPGSFGGSTNWWRELQ
jgi:hypothetical protein